jgi:hypothetical protein
MGDGIRRSKDLRAEIGKFPNSTNERKQMSNKTLKQRIAVVAASALTAGILSVVATPAANATTHSITTSTGVVTSPAISGSVGTGTITLTGSVTFAAAAAGASSVTEFRISGGTFTSVTSGAEINSDGSKAIGNALNSQVVGLVAKPTTAGRNMVVTSVAGSGGTAALAQTAAALVTGASTTTTITVIGTGTNAVFSSGLSAISIVNTGSTLTALSNADVSQANIVAAGSHGIVSYALKDGNNIDLPSSAIVYASLKSGACVVGTASTVTTGTFVVGTSPADEIYVRQADQDNTPATVCVVDITVNGTVAATKTFTFQGPVASIEVTSLKISTGAVASGLGNLVAKDSAGTLIAGVVVSGIILDSSKAGIVSAVQAGTTLGVSTVNTGTSVSSSTTAQTVGWTCGSTVGTAPVAFRTPNGIGGFITSPTYNVQCGGNPVTYTAALDKASYVPGDIATLTVTGKGSKGETPNDAFVIGSGSATEAMALAGSQLTLVGAVGTDKLTSGSKTYKFVVGSTEGSYNMVVDIPLILTSSNKTLYGAATQTVAYKVASGTTAVSNADVLKSIVALIASINKQIQALQKLILKR